jgi:hypothetical protein
MKKECRAMDVDKLKFTLGFFFTISVIIVFQLIYFNRFLPIQEAWFVEYANQVNSGKIIYKDFHVFIQPIYVFIFSFIQDNFGGEIINFRYYGLFERTFLIGILYLLVSLFTTLYRTIFLTLLVFYLFNSNTADVIYSYYQLTTLFALSSAFLLILFYKSGNLRLVLLSGLLSGLAFMTKQSTGLLVSVALLITIAVISYSDLFKDQKYSKITIFFILGFLLPIVLILFYLMTLGALEPYLTQVWGGATSKGSYLSILFGFWGNMLSPQEMILTAFVFIVIYFFSQDKWEHFGSNFKLCDYFYRHSEYWKALGLICLSFAAMTPFFIEYLKNFQDLNKIYTYVNFFQNSYKLVYVAFFFNAFIVLYYLYKAIIRNVSPQDLPISIIAVTSFAIMYGHGLSGFIEPHAAIISVAMMFAWLLKIKTPLYKFKNGLLYMTIIFIVAMTSFQKGAWMYSWWGWDERLVWSAEHKSNSPLLKGFLLNKDKVEILDGITKTIIENTDSNDAIYTFPHMPLFYLLSDRRRDTFSAVHYFDVCSDDMARSDAKIIELTRPKVIVVMNFPESAWVLHESIFRDGKRSGQREIKELIEHYKSDGIYKSVREDTTSGYNYKIEVLVRKD